MQLFSYLEVRGIALARLKRLWISAVATMLVGATATAVCAAELRAPYVTTAMEVVDAMLKMAKVTRNDYLIDLGSGDGRIVIDAAKKYGASASVSDIYFWVIPAKVAAAWRWQLPVSGKARDYAMTLSQKYQVFSGEVRIGSEVVGLQNPVLRGDQIAFVFTVNIDGMPVKHDFVGRVAGDAITGQVMLSGSRIQGQFDWNAKRTDAKTAQAVCSLAA